MGRRFSEREEFRKRGGGSQWRIDSPKKNSNPPQIKSSLWQCVLTAQGLWVRKLFPTANMALTWR